MMTDKQINDLLDRFMAGETSEQEERLLTDYFCTRTDIPEEWAAYAVMFRGFRQPVAHKVLPAPLVDGCGSCNIVAVRLLVVYA